MLSTARILYIYIYIYIYIYMCVCVCVRRVLSTDTSKLRRVQDLDFGFWKVRV